MGGPRRSDRTGGEDACRTLADFALPSEPGREREAMELVAEAGPAASAFEGPVLVVWASEDRNMPREHGRRLAELLPQVRLIEIPDSYTLIPEDQPRELARAIRNFVRDTP